MRKKEIITEAKRKALLADREKAIVESFAKNFNKIKRLDEAYGMSFEEAKAEAKRISDEEGGVVQHVNQVGEDKFIVSDFFDSDTTVASFGLGIDEAENNINEFEEENELYSRMQQYKNAYQEQPNVSFKPMNDDEKQMAKYVSKYVGSELELSHEMDNYRNLGYHGLSDAVKLGLRNDMDFQTWVQMSHDEDTFRRERGF